MKRIKARRDGRCPHCWQEIIANETEIAMPEVSNGVGGNRFSACWYCVPCASDCEEEGPSCPFLGTPEQLEQEKARRREIAARSTRRAVANGHPSIDEATGRLKPLAVS